jgi:hypothetical protein
MVKHNRKTKMYEFKNRITGSIEAYRLKEHAEIYDMLNLDRYIDGTANQREWKMLHSVVNN